METCYAVSIWLTFTLLFLFLRPAAKHPRVSPKCTQRSLPRHSPSSCPSLETPAEEGHVPAEEGLSSLLPISTEFSRVIASSRLWTNIRPFCLILNIAYNKKVACRFQWCILICYKMMFRRVSRLNILTIMKDWTDICSIISCSACNNAIAIQRQSKCT